MSADEASAQQLAGELASRARDEGVDAFGIAAAERLDRDAEALAAWLAGDRHAGMAWLARDAVRRGDPRLVLPGCRSVVALALNYHPGDEEARERPGRAKVALYARGRDYHRVIGAKVRRLASWLEEASGHPARAFVDTGPVLERGWAERAGIGWIGKNGCLLTRDRGSWLLLAEILSAATLEPCCEPHEEFCGSCTACLEACPTGAIVEPATIDSNRCISYWTIEHRGSIPVERRAGLGEWIFGCDVCQDVCPWNHKAARPTSAATLGRREDLRGLDPLTILGLDEAEFRRRYSGTALMRARWDGMRRNACVVLGNRRDRRALGALEGVAVSDPDPMVRAHAAWAVERIQEGAAS